MGDLNAHHRTLETIGSPNRNGFVLHSILNSLNNVHVLGNKEPTHIRGGRIDYVLLFNMAEYEAVASVVGDLVSDHFALETILGIQRMTFCHKHKRLRIKDDEKAKFMFKVAEWYKEYKSINGHANDENKFLDDLLDVLDTILHKSDNSNRSLKKKSKYFDDKTVQGWNKLLRKAQRKWSLDPSDSRSRETMIQIAQGTSEIRKNARGKYWDNFLEEVSFMKSLGGVWNALNKVRGVKKRIVAHPNPRGKADVLMRKWATASSIGNLPANFQASLSARRSQRRQLVEMQRGMMDETCLPFTRDELLLGIKNGRSTAPGMDGVTYDIINCLIMMKESPLLDLINLSYKNGRLPIKWKLALIVPVPKGNGEYRPISLTSCLCKLMERLILNRLLFVIGDQLSQNLYGFTKGKSTTDCVLGRVLCNNGVKCRVFVDLKGDFDRANKEVILEELVNKSAKGALLQWINSYLHERKAKVWFQGFETEEMELELSVPQGGVLSPTLFNVLMDKIARHNFPRGTEVVIYADDIMIQCRSEFALKNALDQLQSLCLDMGLDINEHKSKIQSCMISENELSFNGSVLEKVNTYKYLGMYIGFYKSMDEFNYVRNICVSRLKPLQVLANRGNGAGIPVLRMMYISTVRSIIDYAAPVLICYSEKELKKLEIIQNQAMRIILGCPMSARIEIMRLELNLPSIIDRIHEIVSVAVVRSIRRGETILKVGIDTMSGIRSSLIRT